MSYLGQHNFGSNANSWMISRIYFLNFVQGARCAKNQQDFFSSDYFYVLFFFHSILRENFLQSPLVCFFSGGMPLFHQELLFLLTFCHDCLHQIHNHASLNSQSCLAKTFSTQKKHSLCLGVSCMENVALINFSAGKHSLYVAN